MRVIAIGFLALLSSLSFAASDPFNDVMVCAASFKDGLSISAGYTGSIGKSQLIAFETNLAQCPGCKGETPKCFISALAELNGFSDAQINQSCFPHVRIPTHKDVLALPFHGKSVTLLYSPKSDPRVWPKDSAVNVTNGYVGPMPVPASAIADLPVAPNTSPKVTQINSPNMRRAIEFKVMDSVLARSKALKKKYPGPTKPSDVTEAKVIDLCVSALRRDGIQSKALDDAAEIAAKVQGIESGAGGNAPAGTAGTAKP